MDGQTDKSSRCCQLFTIPIFSFFSSFLLHSFLGVSSDAPTQHPGRGVCGRARVCACVQSRSRPGRYNVQSDSTVPPKVRRDGKGAPVYANLK